MSLPSPRIALYPLVYEDSEILSPFAQRFTDALRKVMPEWVFVDPLIVLERGKIDIGIINKGFHHLGLVVPVGQTVKK